jgi:hypothetical protein
VCVVFGGSARQRWVPARHPARTPNMRPHARHTQPGPTLMSGDDTVASLATALNFTAPSAAVTTSGSAPDSAVATCARRAGARATRHACVQGREPLGTCVQGRERRGTCVRGRERRGTLRGACSSGCEASPCTVLRRHARTQCCVRSLQARAATPPVRPLKHTRTGATHICVYTRAPAGRWSAGTRSAHWRG